MLLTAKMKTFIKKLLLLRVTVAVAGLMLAGRVPAQTFTTLHSFSGDGSPTGLILSGKTLYGATTGTVFAVSTDGSGLQTFIALLTEQVPPPD